MMSLEAYLRRLFPKLGVMVSQDEWGVENWVYISRAGPRWSTLARVSVERSRSRKEAALEVLRAAYPGTVMNVG